MTSNPTWVKFRYTTRIFLKLGGARGTESLNSKFLLPTLSTQSYACLPEARPEAIKTITYVVESFKPLYMFPLLLALISLLTVLVFPLPK